MLIKKRGSGWGEEMKYRMKCVRYEKRYCGCLDLHPWLGQLAGGNGSQGYSG